SPARRGPPVFSPLPSPPPSLSSAFPSLPPRPPESPQGARVPPLPVLPRPLELTKGPPPPRPPPLRELSSPRRSRPRLLASAPSAINSARAKPTLSASQPTRRRPPKNDQSFPIARFRPTRPTPTLSRTPSLAQ